MQWTTPVPRAPNDDGSDAAPLTDKEIAEQRGDHVLWFHPTQEACWPDQFPYLAWRELQSGGATRQGVAAGELAQLVLPFVSLEGSATP